MQFERNVFLKFVTKYRHLGSDPRAAARVVSEKTVSSKRLFQLARYKR